MGQKKTVLLVRTHSDATTETTYHWAETVKRHFQANNWKVIELAKNDAVRSQVEKLLLNPESYVFLFYGHGKSDEMVGQDRMPVIDLDNRGLLKDQKVYVIACLTAQQLGKEAANIARFYLGYEQEIQFPIEPVYSQYVEKCVNKGILAMLDTPECTIEQAGQQIVDEYTHWIEYFTIGEGASDTGTFLLSIQLRYNRDALRVFGDVSATL
jgi:hypothetical protein